MPRKPVKKKAVDDGSKRIDELLLTLLTNFTTEIPVAGVPGNTVRTTIINVRGDKNDISFTLLADGRQTDPPAHLTISKKKFKDNDIVRPAHAAKDGLYLPAPDREVKLRDLLLVEIGKAATHLDFPDNWGRPQLRHSVHAVVPAADNVQAQIAALHGAIIALNPPGLPPLTDTSQASLKRASEQGYQIMKLKAIQDAVHDDPVNFEAQVLSMKDDKLTTEARLQIRATAADVARNGFREQDIIDLAKRILELRAEESAKKVRDSRNRPGRVRSRREELKWLRKLH